MVEARHDEDMPAANHRSQPHWAW